MNEWLIEKIENNYSNNSNSENNFEIRKIPSDSSGTNISQACQFIVAPFVFKEKDGVYQIPVGMEEKTIIEEIVPHFHYPKAVFSNNQMKYVILQGLKEESMESFYELIETNQLQPQIKDLYAGSSNGSPDFSNCKTFIINKEKLSPYYSSDFELSWSFLKRSFILQEGEFNILPNNWFLSDSLKENVTIRTFIRFCKEISLTIDMNTNKINIITLA
ncbi:hypothetical protein [Paenibacillus elgii]|uniref:hypothetical protein n=1 Tax=Paenibacillus elgii TaxID=189691 RepID=UPI00203ECCFA|nr:hypothetical protein [Paenibacillus elgii]MCM3271032.1 hypothetical protein [Paenibacillus elgii]